jgi:hypothetical protein
MLGIILSDQERQTVLAKLDKVLAVFAARQKDITGYFRRTFGGLPHSLALTNNPPWRLQIRRGESGYASATGKAKEHYARQQPPACPQKGWIHSVDV